MKRSSAWRLLVVACGITFVLQGALADEMSWSEQDFNEPNDTMEQATPVEPDWVIEAVFGEAQDVDWYHLDLPVAGLLGVEVEQGEADARSLEASVFNPAGQEIGRGGVRLTKPAEIFVRLTGSSEMPERYRVTFVFLEEDPDRFEPNDTAAQATPLALDPERPTAGATIMLFPAGDEDCFRVSVGQAGYLISELFGAPELLEPTLELRGENGGVTVLSEPIRIAQGSLLLCATAKGTSIQPFNLTLTLVSEMDTCEPNDTPEGACRITPGQVKEIGFFPESDVDWYEIHADRSGIIALSLLDVPVMEFDEQGEMTQGLKLSAEAGGSEALDGGMPLVRQTHSSVFIEANRSGNYRVGLRGQWVHADPLRAMRLKAQLLEPANETSGSTDLVIVGIGISPEQAAHLELPLIAGSASGRYHEMTDTEDVGRVFQRLFGDVPRSGDR